MFGTPADEGCVDRILKGDLDIEFMRDEAGKKAADLWDLVNDTIGHLPQSEPWVKVRERIEDIEEARRFYHNQPRNLAVKSHEKLNDMIGWGRSIEEFDIPKEKYVLNARNNAISTFAIVKDGKWIEKGEMGWFGMVSNEKDQTEWDNEFNKMIDELPDDTQLTLVDCHI